MCSAPHMRRIRCPQTVVALDPRTRSDTPRGQASEVKVLVWLPLAAPIGLSPLLIQTLCAPSRALGGEGPGLDGTG